MKTDISFRISLEELNEDRLERVRIWRNNNRKHFINAAVISKAEHLVWFRSLPIRLTKFYIVKLNQIDIGTISVSQINDFEIEIGNVLVGERRFARKGIIGEALEQIIDRFPEKTFILHVLKKNLSAIKFYKKHRFYVYSEKGRLVTMKRNYEKALD